MNNRKIRYAAMFITLAALLITLTAVNLLTGSVSFSFSEVIDVITGNSTDTTAEKVILQIRLPRIIAAMILGGALSLSGLMLQSFFSNPIAGPFVLGISSGAKLTVALAMIISMSTGIIMNSASMIIAAFIGSLAATAAILAVSGKMKNMSYLIICGIMIGYICSAITELAVTFADDSNIVNLHNWSMGTFSSTSWKDVAVMTFVVVPAFAAAFLLSKPMSAYQLGESYAENLGVNVKRFKTALIILSSLLSACVTAFAGPVSFVGVAVPHLVRSIFRTSKPIIIIPASFIGGAVFCLFCDLLARTVFSPTELSISTVTAVFGAPVVLWIMLRRSANRNYEA